MDLGSTSRWRKSGGTNAPSLLTVVKGFCRTVDLVLEGLR
jgi:hypothetical protein